jgi:hypothetical protein
VCDDERERVKGHRVCAGVKELPESVYIGPMIVPEQTLVEIQPKLVSYR